LLSGCVCVVCVQEYVVKVKDEDTNLVYHVTKRYSEFYALFKQVR